VTLWNLKNIPIQQQEVIRGCPVGLITISSNGKYVATSCSSFLSAGSSLERTVDDVVEVRSLTEDHKALRLKHEGPVEALHFGSDGKTLTTLEEHRATVWALPDGTEIRQVQEVIRLSPDGEHRLVSDENHPPRIINVLTPE
jgi:WD40 repeat protein